MLSRGLFTLGRRVGPTPLRPPFALSLRPLSAAPTSSDDGSSSLIKRFKLKQKMTESFSSPVPSEEVEVDGRVENQERKLFVYLAGCKTFTFKTFAKYAKEEKKEADEKGSGWRSKLPMQDRSQLDQLKEFVEVLDSFTELELRNYHLIDEAAYARVAGQVGKDVSEIKQVVKNFESIKRIHDYMKERRKVNKTLPKSQREFVMLQNQERFEKGQRFPAGYLRFVREQKRAQFFQRRAEMRDRVDTEQVHRNAVLRQLEKNKKVEVANAAKR